MRCEYCDTENELSYTTCKKCGAPKGRAESVNVVNMNKSAQEEVDEWMEEEQETPYQRYKAPYSDTIDRSYKMKYCLSVAIPISIFAIMLLTGLVLANGLPPSLAVFSFIIAVIPTMYLLYIFSPNNPSENV